MLVVHVTRNEFFNNLQCCRVPMRLDYLHLQEAQIDYGFKCDRCGGKRQGRRDKLNNTFSVDRLEPANGR